MVYHVTCEDPEVPRWCFLHRSYSESGITIFNWKCARCGRIESIESPNRMAANPDEPCMCLDVDRIMAE